MEISKISVNWGGANKLKWTEKIDNSLIDPPTTREGRVKASLQHLVIRTENTDVVEGFKLNSE